MYIGPGGNITFSNMSVVNNTAVRFGGGVGLGGTVGASTCGIIMTGCQFDGNVAMHGGSQLSMACNGDMALQSSTFSMNTVSSQVSEYAHASPYRVRTS